ncbi:DUF4139 domain-containing protein [candidate division KSB1 bacterium]|nr:DUF4139 domain-containing protein [candidate division KSB1 bacterium]
MMKFIGLLFLVVALNYVHAQGQDMSLTIYNEDLALVKEIRDIKLSQGLNQIEFTEVAAHIDPTSVHVKSIDAPNEVKVIEQNFEYDLVSKSKILKKYIDEEISVATKESGFFQGQLLSASDGTIVLKMNDGGIKILSEESIISVDFPKLPEGLITKPTLVWQINSSRDRDNNLELSYLTSNINWHAEYVAVVKDDDRSLEMNSWVTIDNRSGATYKNAKLKLVAGDVNLVREAVSPRAMGKSYMVNAQEMAAPQFEERSFFEYHLYELGRRTTVRDNQTKQIALFEGAKASAKKIYIFDESKYNEDIGVTLEFKNSKENGLGIPLPMGKVRVYKEDVKDKSLEFIGEDKIEHTPKDEKVRIYLGNAFDIKATRKVLNQKRLSDRAREETIEIELRNRKSEKVNILVVEHLWGDWTVKESTHTYKKKDAYTLEFDVPVDGEKEVTVQYTVLKKW